MATIHTPMMEFTSGSLPPFYWERVERAERWLAPTDVASVSVSSAGRLIEAVALEAVALVAGPPVIGKPTLMTWYPHVDRESITLAHRILEERSATALDPEGLNVAKAAQEDAITLLRRNRLANQPRVMFSSDGMLTLQWQRGTLGVALILAGDGIVSIAFRRPGQFYAEKGIDVPVSGPLPAEFFDVLTATLR